MPAFKDQTQKSEVSEAKVMRSGEGSRKRGPEAQSFRQTVAVGLRERSDSFFRWLETEQKVTKTVLLDLVLW